MPTYQYACTNDACALNFERVQAFTDDPVSTCPDCAARVRKVYGSVGVVFKGSGFYRNDSRETKSSAVGAGDASSSSSSSSSSSDSSASKPATDAGGSKPSSDTGGAKKPGNSQAKPSPAVAS
jgi:putative FmdB family regulatory protein